MVRFARRLSQLTTESVRDWPLLATKEPIPPFFPPPPFSSGESNPPDIGHFRRIMAGAVNQMGG